MMYGFEKAKLVAGTKAFNARGQAFLQFWSVFPKVLWRIFSNVG